ncbi:MULTISPECIES: phage tail sheath C-terminal domain-containing protein [unclassified Caballeronia]|uniref:phage tail sheath family protein n=1 Tax=unclassified Caballeronia TaxID=2646786 RepID=UPI0028665968|nr:MULTISPECIES: phage tail sheath C-terminal domain-containing protein [unclassified Caballeronia]MDR5816412.1 phage tail sheath C-terminal domain-containing protein [Caballeronia sp. LZ033]MDR5881210.1 phage tail sheath C-terminal domain-containing protein [Caballeronia sp. LZ032]
MAVTTSFPGVYVTEDQSPALSVGTASTTVPLFSMHYQFSGTAVRFEYWLDVVNYLGTGMDLEDAATAGLRAYFDAGGGPCYAVSHDYLEREAGKLSSTVNLIVENSFDIPPEFQDLKPDDGIFLILDGPKDELTTADRPTRYGKNALAAVYYPWIRAKWTKADIAPSAVMAALYCKNDKNRGVWKAPANMPLPAGFTPKYKVSDDLQGQYMSAPAINMIRTFHDQNPVVWGARTLDETDEWRYVPVRRLFISAERDIRAAMNALMFEPNMPNTWEKVRSAVTSYLRSLWQQGGLTGVSEEEAFFVQIGKNVTMSQDEIEQGKMIVRVGMAATRPAEFIILEVTQNVQSA